MVFLRTYDYQPGDSHVTFNSESTVEEESGNRTIGNSIALLILTSANLAELTSQAGFVDIALYGSFAGEPFGPDSFPAILTARRG